MINKIKLYISNAKSDFYLRQRLLFIVVVVAAVFLLFNWTGKIANSMISSRQQEAQTINERISKVHSLTEAIKSNSTNTQKLSTGLQSFIQNTGNKLGVGDKLINIKLVSSANMQEQVSFRSEDLVYQEFILLLSELERYDNVWVRSIVLTKRFDNPMHIDAGWEVVRGEN